MSGLPSVVFIRASWWCFPAAFAGVLLSLRSAKFSGNLGRATGATLCLRNVTWIVFLVMPSWGFWNYLEKRLLLSLLPRRRVSESFNLYTLLGSESWLTPLQRQAELQLRFPHAQWGRSQNQSVETGFELCSKLLLSFWSAEEEGRLFRTLVVGETLSCSQIFAFLRYLQVQFPCIAVFSEAQIMSSTDINHLTCIEV